MKSSWTRLRADDIFDSSCAHCLQVAPVRLYAPAAATDTWCGLDVPAAPDSKTRAARGSGENPGLSGSLSAHGSTSPALRAAPATVWPSPKRMWHAHRRRRYSRRQIPPRSQGQGPQEQHSDEPRDTRPLDGVQLPDATGATRASDPQRKGQEPGQGERRQRWVGVQPYRDAAL